MRTSILTVLLLLSACSKPAEPPQPDVSASPAPVASVDIWPGTYENDNLRLTISGPAGARKVVLISAASDCTGDIGVTNSEMTVKDVSATELGIGMPTQGKGWCEVRLERKGDHITVDETEECGVFHGATCSFNGTVTRFR